MHWPLTLQVMPAQETSQVSYQFVCEFLTACNRDLHLFTQSALRLSPPRAEKIQGRGKVMFSSHSPQASKSGRSSWDHDFETLKGKTMSEAKNQQTKSDASRVKVGPLPQQEKKLEEREAENVKGSGGPSGGVLHIGEEIPQ